MKGSLYLGPITYYYDPELKEKSIKNILSITIKKSNPKNITGIVYGHFPSICLGERLSYCKVFQLICYLFSAYDLLS